MWSRCRERCWSCGRVLGATWRGQGSYSTSGMCRLPRRQIKLQPHRASSDSQAPPPAPLSPRHHCPRLFYSLSRLRHPRYGGSQEEEGPICGRGVRVWSQLWRSSWGRCPASCPGLWRPCSAWVWSTSVAGLWSTGSCIWTASSSSVWPAASARPQCAQPAIRADGLGSTARPSCAADATTYCRYTAKPIVPLGPHCYAFPRFGALQSSSADPPTIKCRCYTLRIRKRV